MLFRSKGDLTKSPGVSIDTTDIVTTMKISTGTGDITTSPVVSNDAGSIIESTRPSIQTMNFGTKRGLSASKQKSKSTAKPVLPTVAGVFPVKTDRKKLKPIATSKKFAQQAVLTTKRFSTKKHVKTIPLTLKTEKHTQATTSVKVKAGVVKTNKLHTEKTTFIPDTATKAMFHGWPHGVLVPQNLKLDHVS